MSTDGDNTVRDGDIVQQVDHFQHLGALISEDAKCEAAMRTIGWGWHRVS